MADAALTTTPASAATTDQPLFEVRGIGKSFGGERALDGVTLAGRPGEVLAIVGENGAGKSTLMKTLAGAYPYGQYEGEIFIRGERAQFSGVRDAEEAGVVLIPQELQVLPELTVAENLLLGVWPTNRGRIRWDAMLREAQSALADFGVKVDVTQPMRTLRPGRQQLVEIAKAMHRQTSLLILDEPTASLTRSEADLLFEHLREMKRRGVGILFVSHRIDEVKRISDRIAVLRDGQLVDVHDADGLDHEDIVERMLGRAIEQTYPPRRVTPGSTRLEVRDLRAVEPGAAGRAVVDNVSFSLRSQEILGVFGLVGAGRTEAALALFGAWPGEVSGEVRLDGRPLKLRSPGDAIAGGLALVTEDRKASGLVLGMEIPGNVSLANLRGIRRGALLDYAREYRQAAAYAQRLRLKAPRLTSPVHHLSGGNQQKVVFAKWLATQPDVLLLDEPTRGVDIGAKVEIYRELGKLTEEGVSVLFISSELPEILGVCDRVIVMYQGRLVGEFNCDDMDERRIMRMATGGT